MYALPGYFIYKDTGISYLNYGINYPAYLADIQDDGFEGYALARIPTVSCVYMSQ